MNKKMKKTIKLNESQLKKMIEEALLSEIGDTEKGIDKLNTAFANGYVKQQDKGFAKGLNESQLISIVKESILRVMNETFKKPDNWKDTPFNGTYQDEDGALYMPDDDYEETEDNDNEETENGGYNGQYDELLKHEMFNLVELERQMPQWLKPEIHDMAVKCESLLGQIRFNKENQ